MGRLLQLLLLAALGVTIAYRYPAVRYRHLRYRVDPDGLRIQHGVVWRKITWVPITRVQHTDVSRGPLQRNYELAKLTVDTAGTEGSSIPLSGPCGCRHDAPGTHRHHARQLRRSTGPGVGSKTSEPGPRSSASGNSRGSSGRSATVRYPVASTNAWISRGMSSFRSLSGGRARLKTFKR